MKRHILKISILVCTVLLFQTNTLQAQSAPVYAGLDHAELIVSDLKKSLAFYTRLFGNEVYKNRNTERRYLQLGASYLALQEGSRPGVEHTCLGIVEFDISAVHHYLDQQGIIWQDYPSGRDLRVRDGDGITTQLADRRGWDALLENTASAEPVQAQQKAIFQALILDEIYIMVTNMEVDSLFYSRLLGQTGTLQTGSLWFTAGNFRLRLSQVPVGQTAGLNYLSVLVSNADMNEAAEQVFAAGGIIENILPNGFSFWDPDGLRIVVRTTALL